MIKVITMLNWVLIACWGAYMVYALLIPKSTPDAAGRGQETTIIAIGFVIVLVLTVLNILPYNWTKVVALIVGSLMMWLMWQMIYN